MPGLSGLEGPELVPGQGNASEGLEMQPGAERPFAIPNGLAVSAECAGAELGAVAGGAEIAQTVGP